MKRQDWFALLRRDTTLDPQVKFAALAIGSTATAAGTRAMMSARELARTMGRSERSAVTYLSALRRLEWITQTEQGGRRGNKVTASIYDLTQPATQTACWEQAPTRNGSGSNTQPELRSLSIKERDGDVRRSLGLADEVPSPTVEDMDKWAEALDDNTDREHVIAWALAYSYLTSITKAAARLAEFLPASVRIEDTGWPGEPNERAKRLLWIANITAWLKSGSVAEWSDPNLLSRALDAGMKLGMSMDQAAALLLAIEDDQGHNHPPAYLTKVMSPKAQRPGSAGDPSSRIALRESRQYLDTWRQQARDLAEAKAATDAADAA
jgi:hypothetical protein